MANVNNKPFGLIASFKTAPDIYEAAKRVRDAGYKKWDVFTPFPVHGMDGAMGLKRSRVPRFTLIGGLTGFWTGVLITWYMNGYDYPLIVGGKPFWSFIFPFPVLYELTILFAAFGTFFGMFISNKLPEHHHPTFDHPAFNKASDDTFFILIQNEDPQYDAEKTRALLEEIGGEEVTLLEE
ncbi:MAG TPA: DUF3341 domain-containing protein [Opitutae bacterium]|nr:DUF3341 domain-containing protein [Opitutae bacterium]|tara:strand:+ start:1259 stop:1801 length:543 start_codon:yes stop_codon:yes gene_type:complete